MVLITMLSIVINFFENVDKFLNDDVNLKDVFLVFYLNFIPWINGLLWPLFALLSVIFFTSRMAGDSEIVATLSAGVSFNRILRPILLGGLLISTMLWVGNNYIIPNSTRLKNEFESTYMRKGFKQILSSDLHIFTSPSEIVYFRFYNSRDSSARTFRLEKYKDDKLVYLLKADNIKYIRETKKWKLIDYEIHTFDNLSEKFNLFKGGSKDTLTAFHPEDFVRYTKQMEMLTTDELKSFIQSEKDKGLNVSKSYSIELYRRTADPFTIIILSIIAFAIASRKVRGGIGLHLALGVIIGAVFVILSKFSVTFASNETLPPWLGVWIPNILFSFVAFYLYLKAQK